MKTEVERRSRAQASNPKSPVDVGGRTYRTGILINERIHPAFEKLPEGLKLEKEFAARLEPDRLDASDAADDEGSARGTRSAK
jgi:hypothetical protein